MLWPVQHPVLNNISLINKQDSISEILFVWKNIDCLEQCKKIVLTYTKMQFHPETVKILLLI